MKHWLLKNTTVRFSLLIMVAIMLAGWTRGCKDIAGYDTAQTCCSTEGFEGSYTGRSSLSPSGPYYWGNKIELINLTLIPGAECSSTSPGTEKFLTGTMKIFKSTGSNNYEEIVRYMFEGICSGDANDRRTKFDVSLLNSFGDSVMTGKGDLLRMGGVGGNIMSLMIGEGEGGRQIEIQLQRNQ